MDIFSLIRLSIAPFCILTKFNHTCNKYNTNLLISNCYFLMTFNPNSFNCSSAATEGEPSISDKADVVFGNAITSLIDCAPVNIIANLSNPKAMPPCGGAP